MQYKEFQEYHNSRSRNAGSKEESETPNRAVVTFLYIICDQL